MNPKSNIIRHTLFCALLLSCSYTAKAQSGISSGKIIESVSHEEVAGALSIVNSQGEIYKIQRSQIDASIVVNESSNSISLEATDGTSVTQSLAQGIAILNVNGVTILIESDDVSTKSSSSYYYSQATNNSNVSTVSSAPSNAYAAATAAAATQTTTTAASAYPATSSSYAAATTSNTSSSGAYTYGTTDYVYVENDSSYDRTFETSLLIGGGLMFEDETITLANLQLRGALKIFEGFKVAVALSGDMYTFPAYTGLNYYSDMQQYLYMVSGLVGFEVSLPSSLDSSVFPTKILADVGYGYSVVSEGFKGYSICPGVVWDLLEMNDSSVYTVLSYKYQQFSTNSYGGSLMVSVGYKF